MTTSAWGLAVLLDNTILKALIQNSPQLLLCNYLEFELGPGGRAWGLFIRYLEPGGAGGKGKSLWLRQTHLKECRLVGRMDLKHLVQMNT